MIQTTFIGRTTIYHFDPHNNPEKWNGDIS